MSWAARPAWATNRKAWQDAVAEVRAALGEEAPKTPREAFLNTRGITTYNPNYAEEESDRLARLVVAQRQRLDDIHPNRRAAVERKAVALLRDEAIRRQKGFTKEDLDYMEAPNRTAAEELARRQRLRGQPPGTCPYGTPRKPRPWWD